MREATTIDLDMTTGQFIQFTIMLDCPESLTQKRRTSDISWSEANPKLGGNPRQKKLSSREEGILVQFSNDGGISWQLLKVSC